GSGSDLGQDAPWRQPVFLPWQLPDEQVSRLEGRAGGFLVTRRRLPCAKMRQGVDLGCSNGQRVDLAHGFPGAAGPGQMADESGQGDGLAGLVLNPLSGLSGGGELAKAGPAAGQVVAPAGPAPPP